VSGFAARLRELSVAATPGPWATEYSPEAEGGLWVHAILQLGHPRHYIADPVQLPDASLIVTLRNHAEEIAAVIEAAENATHWAHGPGDPCPGCKMRAALRALGEPK
jgi:hypothetical protein